MKNKPIVIMDDEINALISMRTALMTLQYDDVTICKDPEEFWNVLKDSGAEVVLLDLIIPDQSGEEILEIMKQEYPEVPVIMITCVSEVETAVRCMRNGAFDYLTKPIERDDLKVAIKRAVERKELERCNEALASSLMNNALSHHEVFTDITTRNQKMMGIFKYVEAVAPTRYTVLITGETGTGKELFAKAIHSASGRSGHFVPVNVAGLDDSMFIDTLFGHAKGAFTGAEISRTGFVEKAENGTLFLDEIGDLSMSCQVKLLRLLQEQEYLPLGSELVKYSNCRIVAATSRTIDNLSDSSCFRKDLYYRLKTHHIHVPALRERKEDIVPLYKLFLERASRELGKKTPHVPEEIEGLLSNYSFPGNVRELKSLIYDAVANHQGKIMSLTTIKSAIGYSSRAEFTTQNTRGFSDWETLPTFKEAEEKLLMEAIRRTKGNRSLAATLLGVTQSAVSQRMKKRTLKSDGKELSNPSKISYT